VLEPRYDVEIRIVARTFDQSEVQIEGGDAIDDRGNVGNFDVDLPLGLRRPRQRVAKARQDIRQ
jgi:hypothetical protein